MRPSARANCSTVVKPVGGTVNCPPHLLESTVLSRLQTYIPTAALAILIFYFAFHALTGDRGLLLSRQREATLTEKVAELKRVRAERADLEARARYLSDES